MNTEQIIKRAGIRNTSFRNQVLELFVNSRRALSSQDIESNLKEVDRSTLFRTLRTFENKGIIHKAIDGTSTMRYAMCSHDCSEHVHHDQHIHFRCISCKSTLCMDELSFPNVDLPAGFVAEELEIIIKGICDECGVTE